MSKICGRISVPGDKSITNIALLLGALAEGTSIIDDILVSADTLETVSCLRMLGVKVRLNGTTAEVDGCGLNGLKQPKFILQAGNSAATVRLLTGILSAQKFDSAISGDDYLQVYPMGNFIKPLRMMGARISASGDKQTLPLRFSGTEEIHPINYKIPQDNSQIKSTVMLAGLYAKGETVIEEAIATRDHTERMLRDFGVDLKTEENKIILNGEQHLQAHYIRVPGDISAAAFFLTAAVLMPGSVLTVNDVGINPTRTGLLDVMKSMGAELTIISQAAYGSEPVAELLITSPERNEKSSDQPRFPLKAISIDETMIPRLLDELPLVALLAVFAEGTTEIHGAAELRHKKCDWLHYVAEGLRSLGADIEELADGWRIVGTGRLHGGNFSVQHDQILALLAEVADLVSDGKVSIDDQNGEDVSFPDFHAALERVLV